MKKTILSLALFMGLYFSSYAQAPDSVNYQAVVRDVSGNVIPNQSVGVQISILSGSATGTVVYTETHTVTSNSFGLINLMIESGTATTGDFSTIDWGANSHFVEISMDLAGGTNYSLMGTSQLVSVPYALYAATAGSVANDQVDDADNDPTNEITSVNYNGNGTTTITDVNGGTVTIDNDSIDNVDDADNDPTNEIETWSTLAGIPAGFADGTDNVDDADNNPTNEIETWSTLAGIPAGFTDGTDNVDDADNNPTNEIQTLSFNSGTNSVAISSGNSVSLNLNCAFFAFVGTAVNMSAANILIPFQVEDFDLGNNYDPATGRFIAPATGVYHFDVGTYKNEAAGSRHAIQIYRNGTFYYSLEYWAVETNNNNVRNGSFTLRLNAGETIQIYGNQNGPCSVLTGRNSFFSGYRIQ